MRSGLLRIFINSPEDQRARTPNGELRAPPRSHYLHSPCVLCSGCHSTNLKWGARNAQVRLLDGRDDILHTNEEGEDEEYSPNSMRWKSDSDADVIASVKVSVIQMLTVISNIRENYRLSQLLCSFQDILRNRRESDLMEAYDIVKLEATALRRPEEPIVLPRQRQRASAFGTSVSVPKWKQLSASLNETFEKLFVEGDGVVLDLQSLAGDQDLESLLIDCMMYEHDGLFEGSFQLLLRRFGQRRYLIESLKNGQWV